MTLQRLCKRRPACYIGILRKAWRAVATNESFFAEKELAFYASIWFPYPEGYSAEIHQEQHGKWPAEYG